MKSNPIHHGNRHRPSRGRRRYRELKHSDDALLSRGREQDRDLEPEEWPWRAPCQCCNFNYGFDEKLRVMLLGRQPLPLSAVFTDAQESDVAPLESQEELALEVADLGAADGAWSERAASW
jgi:hypothetical protein